MVACENIPQVGIPRTDIGARARQPEQAAGMRGRAVALHARAQEHEAAEHRIQRIERARSRDDQQVGALAHAVR